MQTKNKNGNGSGSPVLHFEHIERRESNKFQINVQVLDMLEKYPDYVAQQTGRKPPVDQVVEKALEQVLTSDVGFKKYLHSANGKTSAKGGKQAADTGAKSATSVA